jgi:outer membrane receptor protein involved in Fe transport
MKTRAARPSRGLATARVQLRVSPIEAACAAVLSAAARRKKLLRSLIGATLTSAVAVPTISWAQTADATLRGKAAANSEVTAREVATGATRRTKAGADGTYALVGLPPGTYRVDAGPGTETAVTLTVASTATLDLQPGTAAVVPAGTLEEITVKATRLVEVKTSEIGTTLTLHEIETVPQITRNFLEFADTVPGVVFSVDSNGNTSLRGGAQNNNSINVFIDGVGQKNYVHGGGISGQTASQGNPFPQLAIGEYKVITSNYKAEFDQVSSAAVTAETKSGTNEFHAEVFDTFTTDSLRSKTPSEAHAGIKIKSKNKEYGFAIGGPIIADQLHYFFTYEGKRFTTPSTVVPGLTVSGVDLVSLLPASVQSQFGPSSTPFDENLFFGKLDWEFSDRDRIELSSKVRKETQTSNGGQTAPSAGVNAINDDTRVAGRWQHGADRWFNDFLLSYEKTNDNPTPVTLGNGAIYTWALLTNNNTIISTGGADPRAFQNKNQKGPAIQDDLSFSDLSWNGDHVVKMGVKFKDVTLTAQDASATQQLFFYDVTPTGTLTNPYKATSPNITTGQSLIATSKNKQFGVYIQDDWAINHQLTLNLGVRWDYEQTPSFLNHHTPDYAIAAFNKLNPDPTAPPGQTYAQALALGAVNINNYISTGNNRKAPKDEIQPRLGFSYDLQADEKHVIFGGIGRAYDRNLFDYVQLETTTLAFGLQDITFPNAFHTCTPGPNCIAWDPKYLNPAETQKLGSNGGDFNLFNNHLKVPYSDQFSIGIRNRVGDWNTSVSVARINSYDGLAATLGNRYPNGAFWMSGSQPWGDPVPGFSNFIKWDNGIKSRNTQLLLSADKPYTKAFRWGASVAYTYTSAKQNRDINQHYSFDQGSIQEYVFITSNAASRHRLVATGSIDGPWNLVFAGKLTLATPIPDNGLLNYNFPNTAPNGANNVAVAGTPSNAFGYRSVDLQTTKDFDLARGSVYVRLDILNAFNYKNYSSYNTNYGFSNPVVYNTIGDITGVPRTLKVSAGCRW